MSNAYYGDTPSDAYTIDGTVDHDVTFPTGVARGFRVGTAGDVEVVTYEGTTTVINVEKGDQVDLLVTKVLAGNTNAGAITLFK